MFRFDQKRSKTNLERQQKVHFTGESSVYPFPKELTDSIMC